jgi:O-antigen ligase
VPLLPLLACFLGGATQKWAEGIVVALLGLLLLMRPPRASLGLTTNAVLLLFLACAATSFLPARWFFQPAWRHALVNDFGVNVGSSLSPQPWLSFGCFLSVVAGLCWLYYVATQELDTSDVRHQMRIFAGGVGLLATLAIGLYLAQSALPFWHNQRGFGPFPNRNQTGDLLGIAAVVILACGQDDFRGNRKRWIVWLCAVAIVITAIVLNFSRAGVAILVGGSALWLGSFALRRGSGARLAIGACALLVLLTVMLIFGGETLERFNMRGDGTAVTADFRWLIFQDTWQLIRASPWSGIGLANFEPVFAIFRDVSIGQSKALHPESDWLWIAAEIGWPSVLLIAVGSILLVRRVFPLSEGSNQRFRVAALIGALLFALHGFVDVSAHRVGTAYSGLLLVGLSLRRPSDLRAAAWAPIIFRGAGLLLIIVGGTWSYASYSSFALPGGIAADNARRSATQANLARQFTATIAYADRGLRWAPLDWQLYFLRALGKVGDRRPPADALDDFRRARFLEPNAFEVPYQEGVAWLTRQPVLAMTAWREALRRAGPQRGELYMRILSMATQSDHQFTKLLEEYGFTDHELAMAFLERLKAPQFAPALQRLLARDPTLGSLTQEERRKLFDLWTEQGDLSQLAAFIERQPDQLSIAWRGVAKGLAQMKDFRAAVELTRRFLGAPPLPQEQIGESLDELRRRYYADPESYAAGYALAREQVRSGRTDDALAILRHFTDRPSAPAYFDFLEAECWVAKEDWERAWEALQRYERKRG